MQERIDLKAIEKKSWQAYFEDGLWDMFMGVVLLSMIFSEAIDAHVSNGVQYALNGGVMLVIILVMFVVKKFVTLPRIGVARFGRKRKMRKMWILVMLLAALLVNVLLYAAALKGFFSLGSGTLPGRLGFSIGVWVWVMFVFSMMAYWLDFRRMVLIGFLTSTAYAGALLLDTPILFYISGGILLLMGATFFIRFMRSHPLPEAGAAYGTE